MTRDSDTIDSEAVAWWPAPTKDTTFELELQAFRPQELPAGIREHCRPDLPPIIIPLLNWEFPRLGPAGQLQGLEVST